MSTAAATTETRRQLPGEVVACEDCRAPIIWATTVAGPNGRGGKAMPLDHLEDTDYGNTAVWAVRIDRVLARVLSKGETHDAPLEYLAVPHFATCPFYFRRSNR